MKKENYIKSRRNIAGINTTLYFFLFCTLLTGSSNLLFARQNYTITQDDSLALEKVIVERYYDAASNDYTDTVPDMLPKGSVTYRIYIDMKPGYSLQAVYGVKNHELFLKTSTVFFNDQVCYAKTGFNIDAKKLHKGAVALDSWITMGAASRLHTGILKSEDDSIFSFVLNRRSFKNVDGLTKGVLPTFQIFNIDLTCFYNDSTSGIFSTSDGAWAAMGGVKGPTPENRVLIAQLTTNGKLTFALNVQIGTPSGGVVKFVAKNPEGSEIQFDGLTQN